MLAILDLIFKYKTYSQAHLLFTQNTKTKNCKRACLSATPFYLPEKQN
jgi:hypothetical protein